MLQLETELWDKGYRYIACIDEVGRGCLAGDVVACAVIMPQGVFIDGVKDSKKLSAKKREKLNALIIQNAIAIGIGSVNCKIIDEINIKNSTKLAMELAIRNLKDREGNTVTPDFVLTDAEKININIEQKNIIKGDELSHGIASASIVAKVYRDSKCDSWDNDYPGYGIRKHKGYGTKEHIYVIKALGPSEIHRLSFLTKILDK